MRSIARKRQRRKLVESDEGALAFAVRGNTVASEKIDRWMKRNRVDESTLYAPSPAACNRVKLLSIGRARLIMP